jgi:ribosomal protein S18 acetylase RimI-like enzyme
MTALEPSVMTVQLSVSIRLAEKSDIPKLEWYGQYIHFRNLLRRAYREQQRGRRLLLVADCNGFPIGQVFLQLASTNELIADGHTRAYLYSFRVMEMFQGQGIGTRLLKDAETMLIEHGFKMATLSVAKTNPDAMRLYQRNGYRVFAEDAGRWNYVDHRGITQYVDEPCWVLEKFLDSR